MADATAYLLERKGDVTGALALALRTLSSRLSSLRAALQEASLRDVAAEMAFSAPGSPSKRPLGSRSTSGEWALCAAKGAGSGGVGWVGGAGGAAGVGGGPRAGTAAWARWASKVALEGLQEVREACFSLVCVSNSWCCRWLYVFAFNGKGLHERTF